MGVIFGAGSGAVVSMMERGCRGSGLKILRPV